MLCMITLLTYVLHILLLYMSCVVPSPPNDLVVKLRFVDYQPIVTMTSKVSVCMFVCVKGGVCMCMCVGVHVYTCVCLCVHMCVCMHASVCTCVCGCMNLHTNFKEKHR